MRVWTTTGDLRDAVIEQVATKSGLLLTERDVYSLLRRTELGRARSPFNPRLEMVVGLRPEFLEDIVLALRVAIGNLPNADRPDFVAESILDADRRMGSRVTDVVDHIVGSARSFHAEVARDRIAAERVVRRLKLPKAVIPCVRRAIRAVQDRSLNFFSAAPDWSGAISLSKLFKDEHVPSDPDTYLDQRFIDYLGARGEDVQRMHWRNFERLCAEYFRQKDFVVRLGPGRNDGGVDVRAWPKQSSRKGPPLLLIQCKRLSSKGTVEIEVVKAFWADVAHEKSRYGIIATTGRIAAGGVRVAKARQYPLRFAANAEIRRWVHKMWRYRPPLRRTSRGLGVYLHAPVIPLGSRGLEMQDLWAGNTAKDIESLAKQLRGSLK